MIAMSRAHGFMRGRRSWPAATRFVMRLRVLSLPALETMFQLSAAIDHTGVPHPMLLGSVDGEISARSSGPCAVHPPRDARHQSIRGRLARCASASRSRRKLH